MKKKDQGKKGSGKVVKLADYLPRIAEDRTVEDRLEQDQYLTDEEIIDEGIYDSPFDGIACDPFERNVPDEEDDRKVSAEEMMEEMIEGLAQEAMADYRMNDYRMIEESAQEELHESKRPEKHSTERSNGKVLPIVPKMSAEEWAEIQASLSGKSFVTIHGRQPNSENSKTQSREDLRREVVSLADRRAQKKRP